MHNLYGIRPTPIPGLYNGDMDIGFDCAGTKACDALIAARVYRFLSWTSDLSEKASLLNAFNQYKALSITVPLFRDLDHMPLARSFLRVQSDQHQGENYEKA